MDSSSIVCMADDVIARGRAVTPRLDTLSYYDDSEPNWNERPYFSQVTERRGQAGCCIDLSSTTFSLFSIEQGELLVVPNGPSLPTAVTAQVLQYMTEHRNHVLLSGLGGDELLGGVPTPIPELADLLARGNIRKLVPKLTAWALAKRRPVLLLLFDTVKTFLPFQPAMASSRWHCGLNPQWIGRFLAASGGYACRLRILGPLPSFQENRSAVDSLRRQISTAVSCSDLPYEKRYPYLDRDMVEFLFAVPREQLVRPNQRRSLMRRALAAVVPNDILNRKRKAFVTRRSFSAITAEWRDIERLLHDMQVTKLGFIDAVRFREVLEQAKRGNAVPVAPLIRILALECWVRQSSHLLGKSWDSADALKKYPSRSLISRPRTNNMKGG